MTETQESDSLEDDSGGSQIKRSNSRNKSSDSRRVRTKSSSAGRSVPKRCDSVRSGKKGNISGRSGSQNNNYRGSCGQTISDLSELFVRPSVLKRVEGTVSKLGHKETDKRGDL